jgi:hypothetical protein
MEYLLIIAVVFGIYSRSINHGYVVDDDKSYVCTQGLLRYLAGGAYSKEHWTALFYGAGLFKDRVHDNLFRITLTATIACLIYSCFGNIWVALLWAIHPMNNQLTLWLNGRRYQVSLILGLLAYKFPIAGLFLYPMAVYVHPISLPFLPITALFVTPVAIAWALPAVFAMPRLLAWIKQRWMIQNFPLYKSFNWGKPVMAVKCLSEYAICALFTPKMTMYHPKLWGIAELEGNRQRAYALNPVFWLSIALLSLLGYVGWFIGGSCLKGAVIAFLGVLPLLGFWKNPTQIWAQRYASLAMIGFMMYVVGIAEFTGYHTNVLIPILVWYLTITMNSMNMYKDLYGFFWHHFIHYPNNQNAHWFGAVGFNNYAQAALKSKKFNDTAMYSSHSMAASLLWCMRNQTPDLIHNFASKQLQGLKEKAPTKK